MSLCTGTKPAVPYPNKFPTSLDRFFAFLKAASPCHHITHQERIQSCITFLCISSSLWDSFRHTVCEWENLLLEWAKGKLEENRELNLEGDESKVMVSLLCFSQQFAQMDPWFLPDWEHLTTTPKRSSITTKPLPPWNKKENQIAGQSQK